MEFSFCGVRQDYVCCNKHETEDSPDDYEPHPEGVVEGGLVLVNGMSVHHRLQMAPGEKHEEGRDHVLDSCSGVGPGDPHQGLQVVGAEGHYNRGYQGYERKHNSIHHPWVRASVSVKQGLPVVPKRHGDDGEVGADGEHGEEAQEVAQHGDIQHVAVVREVQRVHVVQQRAVEAEDGGEGEEHVEGQDQDVVCQHQSADSFLLRDGRHQGGQRVLAHEGVDTHPEQVGDASQVGNGWAALAGAFTDAD